MTATKTEPHLKKGHVYEIGLNSSVEAKKVMYIREYRGQQLFSDSNACYVILDKDNISEENGVISPDLSPVQIIPITRVGQTGGIEKYIDEYLGAEK